MVKISRVNMIIRAGKYMNDNQMELLKIIRSISRELSQYQIEYWHLYSYVGMWQFWVEVLMIIIPLIILFFSIDKSKALLLGFFGLNYHVWFSCSNSIGVGLGLWEYPYHLIPFLPSFSMDASLVSVCFLLLYQWKLNHNKNIYLYSILLSSMFVFVLKPIMVKFHFIHMFNGINYFHLILFYMAYFIVSKLITNVFIWLQQKGNT